MASYQRLSSEAAGENASHKLLPQLNDYFCRETLQKSIHPLLPSIYLSQSLSLTLSFSGVVCLYVYKRAMKIFDVY